MTLSYYHGGVPHPGYNAGSKIGMEPQINADARRLQETGKYVTLPWNIPRLSAFIGGCFFL
jgi:hypothetical protein